VSGTALKALTKRTSVQARLKAPRRSVTFIEELPFLLVACPACEAETSAEHTEEENFVEKDCIAANEKKLR
jgi:hypothetical protein